MNKILSILAMLVISICASAQMSQYHFTYEGDADEAQSMAEACIDVVITWNEEINNHATKAVLPCFMPVVYYYTDCVETTDIAKAYNALFKKYPAYTQKLSNIKVKVVNSCHVEMSFSKTVKTSPKAKAKTYPSYLIFNFSNGKGKIKREGDKVTDANLAKQSKTMVKVDNTTPLSAVFCPENVNKHIETGYWELVGYDGGPDGPLAAAIIDATGMARSTMVGTIHKNYKGQSGTYYVGGHIAGGESGWYDIYIYNSKTGKLRTVTAVE